MQDTCQSVLQPSRQQSTVPTTSVQGHAVSRLHVLFLLLARSFRRDSLRPLTRQYTARACRLGFRFAILRFFGAERNHGCLSGVSCTNSCLSRDRHLLAVHLGKQRKRALFLFLFATGDGVALFRWKQMSRQQCQTIRQSHLQQPNPSRGCTPFATRIVHVSKRGLMTFLPSFAFSDVFWPPSAPLSISHRICPRMPSQSG